MILSFISLFRIIFFTVCVCSHGEGVDITAGGGGLGTGDRYPLDLYLAPPGASGVHKRAMRIICILVFFVSSQLLNMIKLSAVLCN